MPPRAYSCSIRGSFCLVTSVLEPATRGFRLAWAERLSCIIGEDLSVRRLRFADVVQEEARSDLDEADELAQLDADFSLMALELSRFIASLLEAFGGEDHESYEPAGQAA